MGDLTKNFSEWEFECHGEDCCGKTAAMDIGFVHLLQALRNKIKKPVHVNSGFRCNRHNEAVDGVEGSLHTKGKAADLRVEGMSSRDVAQAADEFFNGIGIYPNHVHLDWSVTKKRWEET